MYFNIFPIAAAITSAGLCLTEVGRVLYLGEDTFGILGIIDASECPPTFNACPDDVRAFLADGYSTLANAQGDLAMHGEQYQLSWDDYERDHQPSLGDLDTVVVIDGAACDGKRRDRVLSLLANAVQAEARVVHLVVDRDGSCTLQPPQVPLSSSIITVPVCLSSTSLQVPGVDFSNIFLAELVVKLVLNAITTGAHIRKGKV